MSQPKIILIAGPTASGKSALALDLARKTNGTIINADAMQIYAGLPLLSAQPDATAQAEIPHELYGALPPSEHSSAGRWLALATDAIQRATVAGRTPILVGGTGLYFRALLGGLSEIPEIPAAVRDEMQQLYDQLGEEKFRQELVKLDPDSASRLARNDRQRLIRAYEVVKHTGQPLGHWHKGAAPEFLKPYAIETHLLMPPRDELYAACDRRFAHMVEHGAIDEVRHFMTLGIDPGLPAAKTIGVRELSDFLEAKVSLEGAIAAAQQATRNYAKRQMTWFRNQGIGA